MTHGVLALTLLVGGARAVDAQAGHWPERENWTLTATGGVLDWEFADQNFSMGAIRFDRPLSKWIRFEVESSLARVEVQSLEGVFDPDGAVEKSSLATVSIGFQGRYRTRFVEPYVGLAVGLFARRDDDDNNVRSNQTTFAVPAGLRVFLTNQIGLRAEVRMRRDQTAFGISSETNWEKTLGISWTFGG